MTMEFKALRIPILTEEVAADLNTRLNNLHGTQRFSVNLETQELNVVFDENQLSFETLISEMTKAGCALQNIEAAVLL